MGICIGSCVHHATKLQDRYNAYKWRNTSNTTPPYVLSANTNLTVHGAIINNNCIQVKELVQRDFENNSVVLNSSGETPLQAACRLGYVKVINTLLHIGCDPSTNNNNGNALHSLIRARVSNYISPLKSTEMLRRLCHFGAQVNGTDNKRQSPLYIACDLGEFSCVEALVELGANVNQLEENSLSPLFVCSTRGDIKCFEFLIKNGAAMNIINAHGHSTIFGTLLTISDLLRKKNFQSLSEAETRVLFTRIIIVERLVLLGEFVNSVDNIHRTALDIIFGLIVSEIVHIQYHYGFGPLDSYRNLFLGDWSSSEDIFSEHSMLWRVTLLLGIMHVLVLAGARRTPTSVSSFGSANFSWLNEHCQNIATLKRPWSLAHLCRLKVRYQAGVARSLYLLHRLPLPSSLVKYLYFVSD